MFEILRDDQIRSRESLPAPVILTELHKVRKSGGQPEKECSKVLRSHKALCERLLAFINSAHFSLPRAIEEIDRAVVLFGPDCINDIAAVIVAFDTFDQIANTADKRGSVEISLHDNGPGIPEEIHARLFDPFAGLQGGDRQDLRRSIARDIIRSYNGNLSFESSRENGTIFRIELPADQNNSAG